VLSVSSTTTLAILAGRSSASRSRTATRARLVTATATLTALVGAMLIVARLMRLGFVAHFHLHARPDRLQGRHRARDRARPAA
jgi:MFS superfamily sulfate permease-like transporter